LPFLSIFHLDFRQPEEDTIDVQVCFWKSRRLA
jgi:hypothetical protein